MIITIIALYYVCTCGTACWEARHPYIAGFPDASTQPLSLRFSSAVSITNLSLLMPIDIISEGMCALADRFLDRRRAWHVLPTRRRPSRLRRSRPGHRKRRRLPVHSSRRKPVRQLEVLQAAEAAQLRRRR